MKPRNFLNLAKLGLIPMAVLVWSPSVHAVNLYWDTNNDTAGFGTAGGTISSTTLGTTTSGWTESATGVAVVNGNSYNAQSNTLIFGTNTGGLGLATGTINVSGRVPLAGNFANMSFGSQSGVITFSGGSTDWLVTGNNGIAANNVQSGGAAPGVIFNSNFAGAGVNSNGDSNGYVQFNRIYAGTNTITVTRGMWEHAGSSFLTESMATPVASFSRTINFNGSTARFKYNSSSDQLLTGLINGAQTAAIFTKANAASTLTIASTTNAGTYTGSYVIEAGTLKFGTQNGLYANNSANWTAAKIRVGSTGVLGLNVGGANQFTTTDVTTLLTNLGGANGTSTTGFAAGSAIGFDTANAAGGTFTVGNIIADSTGAGGGAIGLNKLGTGTLILSGASTYTGATKIVGGTLKLDATGSINNTSGISLGAAGTFDVSDKVGGYTVGNLTGTGTVIGALTISTELAIGNSPGTTDFTDLTLLGSSTYTYELTGGDITADLGNVSGTLNLSSATLDLVQLGTFTINDKFTLFAYQTGNLTGTFAGLADGATFNDAGGDWQINYFDNSAGLNGGTGTSFITITALAAAVSIPEPTTALLASLGVLFLLRRRRA